MAEEDDSQKTEEPTQKKLEEARKKGQVALSRELNNWMILLAATILIGVFAMPVMGQLKTFMAQYIAQAHAIPSGGEGVNFALGEGFVRTIKILTLPLVILMFVAFIAPFIQIGPLFSAETIKPDISKISPLKGFKRLFSLRSLMEFFKGILKLCVVGLVSVIILMPFFGEIDHTVGLPVPLLALEMKDLVVKMMIGVLVVLLVIAVIDVVYQRMEHTKKMKMSKQELKDEYKQTEGDPHIKAKLRQLRSERARRRMMQAVPEADVVITNPTHYSIALQYKPEEMDAPLCLAKGVDAVALRIREVAKEHKIEIYEDVPLARSLYEVVDIDETIPVEYFQAVAKVISFVFQKRGKM